MIAIKHILVATDFSATAEKALSYGRALAQAWGARLHVMHVVDGAFLGPHARDPKTTEEAARRHLDRRLTEEDRKALRAVAIVESSHSPAKSIVGYARAADIDCIVTGTSGRTGAARVLIGSIAEQIVRTAPCPVLAVRLQERDFVVPDGDDARRRPEDPESPVHADSRS